MVKNPPANAGDAGSLPELGRYPGEGNGNPLQYSCLKILQLEEPGGLQFMGLQRVEHNLATEHACIKWEQTAQFISFIKNPLI